MQNLTFIQCQKKTRMNISNYMANQFTPNGPLKDIETRKYVSQVLLSRLGLGMDFNQSRNETGRGPSQSQNLERSRNSPLIPQMRPITGIVLQQSHEWERDWEPPYPRHNAIFGRTKESIFKSCPRIPKLGMTSEGFGRCLKMTLQTSAPENFRQCRWGAERRVQREQTLQRGSPSAWAEILKI